MTPRRHVARAALALAIVVTARPPERLTAQEPFPTRPPGPAPLRPAQFPPFQEVALPNGMTLLLVENHEQPSLSISLSFRAGSAYDPAGKEGLSAFVAELLTKGTPTRDADQIAAAIEGVGGTLSASGSEDFLTVSTDVLSDYADLAFELLGDVTRRPTLPAEELELARTRFLSALELELSQPEAVAARFFGREIYGRHPYGRIGTAASYKAVKRDDAVAFAARRLRPAGALLVVAGDITLARARALATRTFGGWRGAAPATPPPAAVPVKRGTDILLVHRPGSVQSNIVLGNTTFLPTDTGYYAARIATQVLGGGADARLFLILREQKSWTYGSYSTLRRRRGIGSWETTFEGRTTVTDSALVELLKQIDRIRTEAIPDSELTGAKGFLVGSFPLTIETPRQIAQVVTTARLLGLGPDYLRRYRERLAAVSPLRARAAARRVYRRDALTIVVVGDAKEIYGKLRTIAPVRLVDIDGNPMTPADLTPVGGPVAFDRSQLVARSDSFQALVQDNPFGARVIKVEVAADSIVLTESTTLGPFVQQYTTVVLNSADLSARRIDQRGTVQQQQTEIHLTYAGGRVKGTAVTPQGTGTPRTVTVDTTIAPGTIDDNALRVVVTALPLAEGKTFNLNVFSSAEGVTKVATVKVAGVENVTVPAGTFEAYRLEISGMQLPLVMHVTTEAPRRLLRIAAVGAPLVFQLVK
ncbi:MAG TPA: insulinase family protein [Gemmatimonadales bacterium]|jgi:zinc protease|nr:insulinase family protein [Gemmatimonadales bacterium]